MSSHKCGGSREEQYWDAGQACQSMIPRKTTDDRTLTAPGCRPGLVLIGIRDALVNCR